MGRAPRILSNWPVTIFGVTSFLLLLLSARGSIGPIGAWNVLILPAYCIHLLIVVIAVQLFGSTGEPVPPWFWPVTVPLRIAPFLLVDCLLARASRESVHCAGSRDGTV